MVPRIFGWLECGRFRSALEGPLNPLLVSLVSHGAYDRIRNRSCVVCPIQFASGIWLHIRVLVQAGLAMNKIFPVLGKIKKNIYRILSYRARAAARARGDHAT